ncbi:MAG: dCTP deaminase [Pseudonocardiaceae bacterium]
MILTGAEILAEFLAGRITIDPFDPGRINPNSYNFRIGGSLRIYRDAVVDPKNELATDVISIPPDGYMLRSQRLYLASTVETMGSNHYAPTFSARSSVARLGLFINLSAPLGDIGYVGQWTLQLVPVKNLLIYPGMEIGQMVWWKPVGNIELYDGKYQHSAGPCATRIFHDFARA